MGIKKAGLVSVVALAVIIVGIPVGIVTLQAHRKGLTPGRFIKQSLGRLSPEKGMIAPEVSSPADATRTGLFVKIPVGETGQDKPWIAALSIADLDQDGLKDILIGDAKLNEVRWIRQSPRGIYVEESIGPRIMAPAHVAAGDLDRDGDLDVLVAGMGMIFPNNDKIGSVIVLENDGRSRFTARVLVDRIARVSDVEGGDFNGDGLTDLAVGQFGYDDGEIRWLENKGGWNFESHILLSLSGAIHTPVVDIDSDGDLDIVAIVSQEWEELYVFENDGRGNFKTRMVWGSSNEDFGSSGIRIADLNRDGLPDIFYTNGDAFDYIPPAPRPWHGVQWIENKGQFEFVYHRVADLPGAYSPEAADLDNDGDLDLAAVSTFNTWGSPEAYSLVWYENDGGMKFTPREIANDPTHLLNVAAADMDDDGRTDLVTGGFYAYPPYDRQSRVLLWKNTLGQK